MHASAADASQKRGDGDQLVRPAGVENGELVSPYRLEVRGITKSFNGVVAVDDVSLQVSRGESFALLGPSGCGKSTTLRIIAGLEAPDGGSVIVDGKDVTPQRSSKRNIGLVFQDHALFPHLSVADNVKFGLRYRGLRKNDISEKALDTLARVALDPKIYADRMPSELSGGQKQRVAIARALALDPSVILFDEPLASLDRKLRDQLLNEVRTLQTRLGFTAVYVTHDQEAAFILADRMAVMSSGEVQQIGTPDELYHRPDNEFVAGFLGDTTIIPGEVFTDNAGGGRGVRFADIELYAPAVEPYRDGESVLLSLRPQDAMISQEMHDGNGRPIQGTLISSIFMGTGYLGRVRLADGTIIAGWSQRDVAEDAPNGKVFVVIDSRRVTILPSAQVESS